MPTGQVVRVVRRKRHRGEAYVVVEVEDGSRQLIAVRNTELADGRSSSPDLRFTPGSLRALVDVIGLGEVGIVLVTEVSRLSRRNSDWHRVIELYAVFRTLIADEDGIYDPQDPNDRLLLGVKGTLFAAELHICQAEIRPIVRQLASPCSAGWLGS